MFSTIWSSTDDVAPATDGTIPIDAGSRTGPLNALANTPMVDTAHTMDVTAPDVFRSKALGSSRYGSLGYAFDYDVMSHVEPTQTFDGISFNTYDASRSSLVTQNIEQTNNFHDSLSPCSPTLGDFTQSQPSRQGTSASYDATLQEANALPTSPLRGPAIDCISMANGNIPTSASSSYRSALPTSGLILQADSANRDLQEDEISRLERVLEVIDEAGFDNVESMVAAYYASNPPTGTTMHSAQSLSKKRHSRKLLHTLEQSIKTWGTQDALNFREGIMRSAEGILVEEMKLLKLRCMDSEKTGRLSWQFESMLGGLENHKSLKESKRMFKERVSSTSATNSLHECQ